MLKCNVCESENVRVEVKQIQKLRTGRKWWVRLLMFPIDLALWILFMPFKIILKLFGSKKHRLITKEEKILICNSCGNIEKIR